ncbi:hypothetical protein ElyMa_005996500 [Elysia marginata]|uniref:COMM domain-containing protein n=1 Tax=Elysia marginata TaxID=1093978 RepID=A0AAV4GGV3_9GAST|nr:hypothetical protein ElyMa_005996500 [Elysia marginata]
MKRHDNISVNQSMPKNRPDIAISVVMEVSRWCGEQTTSLRCSQIERVGRVQSCEADELVKLSFEQGQSMLAMLEVLRA